MPTFLIRIITNLAPIYKFKNYVVDNINAPINHYNPLFLLYKIMQ